MSKLSFSF